MTRVARLSAALGEVSARGGAALCCVPLGAPTPLSVDRGYLLTHGVLEPR